MSMHIYRNESLTETVKTVSAFYMTPAACCLAPSTNTEAVSRTPTHSGPADRCRSPHCQQLHTPKRSEGSPRPAHVPSVPQAFRLRTPPLRCTASPQLESPGSRRHGDNAAVATHARRVTRTWPHRHASRGRG